MQRMVMRDGCLVRHAGTFHVTENVLLERSDVAKRPRSFVWITRLNDRLQSGKPLVELPTIDEVVRDATPGSPPHVGLSGLCGPPEASFGGTVISAHLKLL